MAPFGAVVGGTALIGLHASRFGNWIVDDAAITFAYARNVADGLGPVLQPGAAPSEGYSNPAWLAVLVLGRLLGLFDRGTILGIPDYVVFPKAVALLCCAGILAGCYAAARKVTRRPWIVTLATGAVLAVIPSFVIWSFSGLENPLFALAVTWLAVVLFRAAVDERLLAPRVAAGAGLLAALAALTRPDGLVYLATYPLLALVTLSRGSLVASVRAVALSVAAFALPYGAYLAWRLAEFGRWTALPAVAKGQSLPEAGQFTRIGELVQYAGALAVLVAALCVGMVLLRPSRLRRGMVALLVPLALGLAGYAVLMPDWMGEFRFATPVWCLAAFTAVLAVFRVARRVGVRGRVLLGAGLVAALVPSASVFATASAGFRAYATVPMCHVAEQFGQVFNGYLDILGTDRATFLLPDVGGSALTSRATIVDLAGLAEPRLAELWGVRDMAGIRDYVFDEVKPTLIHMHPPWSTGPALTSDPRLARDYLPIFQRPGTPDDGDWVRRDAVSGPDRLAALRTYARTVKVRVEDENRHAPRARCGDILRPGQLPASSG